MLELTRMFDVGRAAAKTQEREADDDDDDVEYRRHGRFGVMSIYQNTPGEQNKNIYSRFNPFS